MNRTYYGITQLIKSAVTQKPVSIPEDFEWKTAIDLAKLHKIEVLVYYGAYYSGFAIPEEYKGVIEKSVFVHSNLDVQQEYELAKLCKAFDDSNITYMPLKGMLIKKYYPKSEMRYMGDADILIKQEEYARLEKIMLGLGYKFSVESDHEYIWTKQAVCIELHKRLIPSYNKDYHRYYGDGWQLARFQDNKYTMSDEDFYIYLFTHLAKHYRDSGIGVKQFVDLWVLRRSLKELNQEYINTQLEKLQLAEFHKNCIDMIGNWFEAVPETQKTEYMTGFVFSSGVYGSHNTGEVSAAYRNTLELKNTNNLKLKFYLLRLFMPYGRMKMKYPILKKVPVLLPVMWLVRIFDLLLFKKERIKGNIEEVNRTTDEKLSEYENSINYVGLKFDFKEKD